MRDLRGSLNNRYASTAVGNRFEAGIPRPKGQTQPDAFGRTPLESEEHRRLVARALTPQKKARDGDGLVTGVLAPWDKVLSANPSAADEAKNLVDLFKCGLTAKGTKVVFRLDASYQPPIMKALFEAELIQSVNRLSVEELRLLSKAYERFSADEPIRHGTGRFGNKSSDFLP